MVSHPARNAWRAHVASCGKCQRAVRPSAGWDSSPWHLCAAGIELLNRLYEENRNGRETQEFLS